MSNEIELRPEVQWFAEQMELRLRANDHKDGWEDEEALWLWSRIREEWQELHDALFLTPKSHPAVIREAADVANFAMMIADGHRFEGLGMSGTEEEE